MVPEQPIEVVNFLTVKEVATRLRLSRSAVYNLISRGILAHINLACGGRRVPRIRACDLERFVKSRHRVGAGSSA